MASFANEGFINHGMLGLQEWPTQSCACGSPLFCSLLSGGRKCSTNPLSVHENVFCATKLQHQELSQTPPGSSGGGEGLLFVSQ